MASPHTLSKGKEENPSLEPLVIEYNCRLGDPETEVVIPRIKNDLVELFKSVSIGKLSGQKIETDSRTAATMMLVSGGYPDAYEKRKVISGLDDVKDSILFHAGTASPPVPEGGAKQVVVSNGGRVLAITSFGKDITEAAGRCYSSAEKISFDKMYFRRDIGKDLLSYEVTVFNE
jgi:phosphoribosylamine--glycine ligase